jgi:hypothetical protein
MILYVNGCSHTAAAEAVVPDAFAVDDGRYGIDRRPHPINLEASWGKNLSRLLNTEFYCDAETAASNDRILRTTTDWIHNNYSRLYDTVMVIQWTTWEREEWVFEGRHYQVNASGVDMVPPELEARYRQYILDVNWNQKTDEWHNKIWHLHCRLKDLNVRHLFYSGNSTFSNMPNQRDWQNHYIQPYSNEHSWNAILKNNGFEHVNPKSYHFGANGHRFWSEYVLQYLKQHKLLDRPNEISTD